MEDMFSPHFFGDTLNKLPKWKNCSIFDGFYLTKRKNTSILYRCGMDGNVSFLNEQVRFPPSAKFDSNRVAV